jgi:hypothetical protein
MSTSEIAAIAASLILAALGMFQVFLAAGAPLGHFAWGGRYRVLPVGFRIASAVTIPLYVVMIFLLLDRAGIVSALPDDTARIGTWILVGYFALGVLMNIASRSRPERYVMTPVVLTLAILAAIVASGAAA